MSTDPSLIYLPVGGIGEFAELAERIRAADPVPIPSRTVAIQHTHVEWIDVAATHLGLEALSVHGHFLPLALVPLEPFLWESRFDIGFRRHPLFRLAWYGQRGLG